MSDSLSQGKAFNGAPSCLAVQATLGSPVTCVSHAFSPSTMKWLEPADPGLPLAWPLQTPPLLSVAGPIPGSDPQTLRRVFRLFRLHAFPFDYPPQAYMSEFPPPHDSLTNPSWSASSAALCPPPFSKDNDGSSEPFFFLILPIQRFPPVISVFFFQLFWTGPVGAGSAFPKCSSSTPLSPSRPHFCTWCHGAPGIG